MNINQKRNYTTSESLLRNTSLPQQTDSYKPVSHGQLIDLVRETTLKSGFKIKDESYYTAKNGLVANARYTIANIADSEMELQVGWQNSYDKSLTLKYAIGAEIIICQNGLVRGELGALNRKHTGDVQEFAPNKIIESIKAAGDVFEKIQAERELLKIVEIDKTVTAELVGRMLIDEDFLAITQLGTIRKELKVPTFDYSSNGSLWELYQFTTFAMKDTHPSLWMKKHIAAHDFFVNYEKSLNENKASKILIPVEDVISPNPDIETYGIDTTRQLSIFGA